MVCIGLGVLSTQLLSTGAPFLLSNLNDLFTHTEDNMVMVMGGGVNLTHLGLFSLKVCIVQRKWSVYPQRRHYGQLDMSPAPPFLGGGGLINLASTVLWVDIEYFSFKVPIV